MRIFKAIPFVILCLAGCKVQVNESAAPIQYVSQIINDKESPEMALLLNTAEPNPDYDISILGSSRSCENLSEFLLSFDKHDNIDGRKISDALPDFAGESFVNIIRDETVQDTLALRKLVVQSVLAALDSTIHLSPYDLNGVKGKKPSKLIILSDPSFSLYGKYDADTLLRSVKSSTQIISGIELMLEDVFASSEVKDICALILCQEEYVDSGIYQALFAQKAKQWGSEASTCFLSSQVYCDSLMQNILQDYIEYGNTRQIDALIIDDYSIDANDIKVQVADLLSIMNPSSLIYRQIFSEGFTIVDACGSIAQSCYSLLREGNLFTHNISMPKSFSYQAIESEDRTILIPLSYVQN